MSATSVRELLDHFKDDPKLQPLFKQLDELARRVDVATSQNILAVPAKSELSHTRSNRISTVLSRRTLSGRRSSVRAKLPGLNLEGASKVEEIPLPIPPQDATLPLPSPPGAHDWEALQAPVNAACQQFTSPAAKATWKQWALTPGNVSAVVAVAWWIVAHVFQPDHPMAPAVKDHAFQFFARRYAMDVLTFGGAGKDLYHNLWQSVITAAAIAVLRHACPRSSHKLDNQLEDFVRGQLLRWTAGVLPADLHPSDHEIVGQGPPAAVTHYQYHVSKSKAHAAGSPSSPNRAANVAAVVSGADVSPSAQALLPPAVPIPQPEPQQGTVAISLLPDEVMPSGFGQDPFPLPRNSFLRQSSLRNSLKSVFWDSGPTAPDSNAANQLPFTAPAPYALQPVPGLPSGIACPADIDSQPASSRCTPLNSSGSSRSAEPALPPSDEAAWTAPQTITSCKLSSTPQQPLEAVADADQPGHGAGEGASTDQTITFEGAPHPRAGAPGFLVQQASPVITHLFQSHALGQPRQQEGTHPGVMAHTFGVGQKSRRRPLDETMPPLVKPKHLSEQACTEGKEAEFRYGTLAKQAVARAADVVAQYEACKVATKREVAAIRRGWLAERDSLQARVSDLSSGSAAKDLSDKLSAWIENDVDRMLRDQPLATTQVYRPSAHTAPESKGQAASGKGAGKRRGFGVGVSATEAVLKTGGGASAGAATLSTGAAATGGGRPPGYLAMTAATVAGAGCASASFLAATAATAGNSGPSMTRIMQPWSKMRSVEAQIRSTLSQARHGSNDIAAHIAVHEREKQQRDEVPGMLGNGKRGAAWRPTPVDATRGTLDIRLRHEVQKALRGVNLEQYLS